MSNLIQLLPENVANQIAAGEVVQRPASVVKELMENAIDAQATKIQLIVKEAGRNLIQVTDNGSGMNPTDAQMAFERHATSKIKKTEDIFNINTKGFRGEALASIAAVAQVELKTKKKEENLGTNIYIEGGEIQFQEPTQCSDGSNFLVKNLFYNVPARRKFLKNNNIEFRYILDEFHRISLAHPEIEFDLFHNDQPVFRLRKGTQIQRIVDIFGRKLQPLMVPIKEDLDWIKLIGYVLKPEAAKKNRGEQFFFVNQRFFKSTYLNKAVLNAFEGLLQTGYHPSFFLFLEIDPEKIDVNIHPQKTEVKFEEEHLIFALIKSCIKKSLGIYQIAPSLDFDSNYNQLNDFFRDSPKETPHYQPNKNISVPKNFNPFQSEKKPSQQELFNLNDLYAQQPTSTAAPSKINLFEQEEENFSEDLMRLPSGYWLMNFSGECLMIDPGRISSAIKTFHNNETIPTTGHQLLYSIEYHLNEMEKIKFRSIKKFFTSIGFEITLAQENVLRIDTIPEGLEESKAQKLLEEILNSDYNEEEDFHLFYKKLWEKVHQKSRFDFLYKYEVEKLVKEYVKIGLPPYTSNGKKCFVKISINEFQNQF